MPVKKKAKHAHKTTLLKRFKQKHKTLHTLFVLASIIVLWRAVWGILDTYFFPGTPILSYSVSAIAALLLLFLDDFRLKELER